MSGDWKTEIMCEQLRELQSVKSYDFARAYQAAFQGISGLGNHLSDAGREVVEARILAYGVWSNNHKPLEDQTRPDSAPGAAVDDGQRDERSSAYEPRMPDVQAEIQAESMGLGYSVKA